MVIQIQTNKQTNKQINKQTNKQTIILYVTSLYSNNIQCTIKHSYERQNRKRPHYYPESLISKYHTPLVNCCLYTYLLGKLLETKSYNGTKDM